MLKGFGQQYIDISTFKNRVITVRFYSRGNGLERWWAGGQGGQLWGIGSTLDCWPTGRTIDPAPGA